MAEKVLEQKRKTVAELNRRFVYVLATKNEKRNNVFDERGRPRGEPEYKPRQNLIFRSSIVWPGGIDPFSKKERQEGKHAIRYYDGCTTLFVDDQPREKDVIDQFLASTKPRYFIHGYLECYGFENMLKMYLDWCSYNEDSEYRVATADPIFKLLDSEKQRELEAEDLDSMEKAMELAKNAKEKRMLIHARFLDVMMLDYRTNQPLSPEAIRTEYRKAAKADPKRFLQTYNDESLHLQHWIESALETGQISTSVIPNKAAWTKGGKAGSIITDISGLKSNEAILNKLIEFSQSADGKDFADQLAILFDK